VTAAQTVVIAAGGTGGHIYPAMAVAKVLEKRKVPVVWIGTKEGLEARIVPEANIDIRFINVSGLRGKGLKGMLTGPFKVVGACIQSMRIMSDVRATAVLGMGGFVSGPVGLAAVLTRRMLVLHEQNAVVGMTNKWLGRIANRVYSAMPDVFPDKVGALAVGNPVRDSIELLGEQKLDSFKTSGNTDKPALHVLIIGGSRGARALNQVVPKAMDVLLSQQSELVLHVWHQTGPADEPAVEQAYAQLRKQAKSIQVSAYIDDVTEAYRWADVIICRSGAMTVSELSAAGLPGVLVPYPHHSDNQQTHNAKFLSDAGAAVLQPESTLSAEGLANILSEMSASPDSLAKMASAARALHKPDAAVVMADALQEARN